ncbi:MAG: transposase, partial [Methanothrix sp.]|nr:transposase [Methanothrix sp.]
MSIPGMGFTAASAIIAEIWNFKEFRTGVKRRQRTPLQA